MSILKKDGKVLEKYNKIWDKVRTINGEPVYSKKYLKAKIKL